MVQKQEQFMREMRRGQLLSVVDGRHKKGYFIRCAVMRSVPERDGNSTTSDYLISDLILGKLTDREIIQARLGFALMPRGW